MLERSKGVNKELANIEKVLLVKKLILNSFMVALLTKQAHNGGFFDQSVKANSTEK